MRRSLDPPLPLTLANPVGRLQGGTQRPPDPTLKTLVYCCGTRRPSLAEISSFAAFGKNWSNSRLVPLWKILDPKTGQIVGLCPSGKFWIRHCYRSIIRSRSTQNVYSFGDTVEM